MKYPIKIGDDEVGVAFSFIANHGAPWHSLGIANADLAMASGALLTGKIYFNGNSATIENPMSTIGETFDIGPSHDSIGHPCGGDGRGVFEFHEIRRDSDIIGQDRSLWKIDCKTQRQLIIHPTHKGILSVDDKNKKTIDAIRQSSSILFYNKSIRWTSQSLLTASTANPCMGGNAWTSLQHEDIRVCKAFSLWANSIFGLITHWTQGQRTHAGRSMLKVNALAKIPCPSIDQISEERLDIATEKFDALSKMTLLPACQAHKDDVRKEIDDAVVQMLGLDMHGIVIVIEQLRWLWCNEPSVRGTNKDALKALYEARGNHSILS